MFNLIYYFHENKQVKIDRTVKEEFVQKTNESVKGRRLVH